MPNVNRKYIFVALKFAFLTWVKKKKLRQNGRQYYVKEIDITVEILEKLFTYKYFCLFFVSL